MNHRNLFVYSPSAAESGNWYDPICNAQVLLVPNAKADKQIKPTLREARKFGLLPGVTSIIRCSDKPMLNRWRERQAILAALTLPRQEGEAEGQWLSRVEEDASKAAAEAALRGTAIHAAIQRRIGDEPVDPEFEDIVGMVTDHLFAVHGRGLPEWLSEIVCCHPLGYGTKADLMSEDRRILIDFKSTETAEPDGTYDEHAMQLAATRRAARADGARCFITYIHRVTGKPTTFEVKEAALERGLQMFDALHTFWKAKTGYDPSYRE